MKVKKIACLLTALVISASAAMVPAVANAKAGDSVTVSSTTSYEEGDSTTETELSSAMGLWEASDDKTGGITAESGRFAIGGTGVYKARLKHEGEAIDDCKLNFKAKFNTNSYVGFKLSDGTEKYISNRNVLSDNGATDWDVTVVVKKDGTSSITMKVLKSTKLTVDQEFSIDYTPTNGAKITDVIACGNGASGSARYARIYVPFTVTQLKETTETVTATEAEKYTEGDVTDKIGFYGNANVIGTSKINWYASNGSEWVEGDFDAPTVTADNADVTFGLIIEGTDAATTIQSAAYRLD